MKKSAALASLLDKMAYKAERASAWEKNIDYWLRGPLRHVVDVGDYIVSRTEALCCLSRRRRPVVVDMGFGDGWLLKALLRRKVRFSYVGLDCTHAFIAHARKEFADIDDVSFELLDFEEPSMRSFDADIVVNAFNFFELCELDQPFKNASQFLRGGGTLQVATIDKTYLLHALSGGWNDFRDKLSLYQTLPGIKYAFQPIDLGDGVSEALYYPSVLYSNEDYLSAAKKNHLVLNTYKENVFTGAVVPKIYCHYEFVKGAR